MLMGDNETLDYEDLAYKRIREIWSELVRAAQEALDESDAKMPQHLAHKLALDVFGTDGLLSEIEISFDEMVQDPAWANGFVESVQKMLALGLSKVDIASALEQIPIDLWGNVDISDVLGKIFGLEEGFRDVFFFEGDVFEEMTEDTMKLVYSLIQAGTSVTEITLAFQKSNSMDEFIQKLKEMNGTLDDTPKTAKEYISDMSSVISQMDKIRELRQSIAEGNQPTLSDLMGLAEANPQLLLLVGRLGELDAELVKIQGDAKKSMRNDLTALLLGSDVNLLNADYYEEYAAKNGVTTIGGLRSLFLQEGKAGLVAGLDSQLASLVNTIMSFVLANKDAEESVTGLDKALANMEGADKLKKALEALTFSESYDGTDALQAMATLRDTLKELQGDAYSLGEIPDATTSPEATAQWLANAKAQAEALITSIKAAAEAYGILTDEELKAAEVAAKAREEREKYIESMKELAQSITDEVEANKAQSNGYAEQITMLQEALARGDVQGAAEQWKEFNGTIQNGLQNTYPMLVQELAAIAAQEGNVEDHTEALARELKNAQKQANAKYFKDTTKALSDLRMGTKTATQVAKAFRDEEEKVTEAQLEYVQASQKMADKTEVTADEVKTLAEVLGFATPEALLGAWDIVPSMMDEIVASMENVRVEMQKEIFMHITGTSDADFSDIMNGLIMVEDEANAAVQALMATGQWKIEERELEQNAPVWNPGVNGGGYWSNVSATGVYKVLVPTGSSPFAGGGGGTTQKKSGGGGGGGNQNKGPTEVEIMLDRMQQMQDLQNHSRSLYSAQAGYYEQTGELQGVIKYYQKEIDLIGKQNQTLEANVAELDTWIQKKKAEVASLKNGTEEYETASKELKDLQKRHQEYSVNLINNRTEVDKLTKAIKEQNDAIRNMEIDLRKTILQAIQDREALNERMLQGQIDLENELLGLIQERYEKERDLILKNAQDQIDALQKERDLLDEQLQLRKEQAEEQDKLTELAELEAKYARISADPTRKKEALSLDKQIKDLREEISWDLAEKEVKAQQDAIDNQITSIEDYMKYVEDYYEELFKHPQKLIEEMKTIISQTDEEIMEWLKTNSEEYANKTEATQQDMVAKWQKMIDDMRGAIETYWDEVEAIIEQGDDAIIEFLKENSADYKEAGKLQAEAYVDEWLDKLEKLRLAYKQVNGELTDYAYDYVAPSNGSGSGSGGGGGGSDTKKGWHVSADSSKVFSTKEDAEAYKKKMRNMYWNDYAADDYEDATLLKKHDLWSKATISYYAKGGMAYNTGLAWLDGSPTEPERILSPHQTVLFETLVRSMENMSRIAIPSMPFIDYDDKAGASSVNVGDIIVNVEKMDTDADYEAMAQKVFDTLMERLNRGSVVGGIRFSR